MALTDILSQNITNYSDTDGRWYQFILDHKTYLLNNSQLRNISLAYMQQYINNLEAYLRSINYPTDCAWIVALVNNIKNNIEFNTSTLEIYVPPFTLIQRLYTDYNTIVSNS